MNRPLVNFIFLLISCIAFAQTRHTVGKGETITQIAQRYQVTPYDIYKLNPDAQSGIRENDVLLIPNGGKSIVPKPSASATTHTAKPKETLYSISKQYGVTVDAIMAANPALSNGLKIGQTIKIPAASGTPAQVSETVVETPQKTAPAATPTPAPVKPTAQVKTTTTQTGNVTYHVVQPHETKFGIAKQYGMTVAELEARNPDVVKNLPVGFKLIVSGSGATQTKTEVTERPSKVTDTDSQAAYDKSVTKTQVKTGYANYEVKPKETMYSLTQMLGISEKELIALNPSLKDGLKVGMILKVPGKGALIAQDNSTADMSRSLNTKDRKTLVLLLPFNASRIQGDTLKSVGDRLKKDAFLNMTLDFYSGALMAVDSAKALGMNLDVRIYDSQESKNGSNVSEVVSGNKVQDADAVIGPFYQQYAEQVADMLQKKEVPVISPLSKETGKPYVNLYQAMPSVETQRAAMMDYMMSKHGNIIVVNDPKRTLSREFITSNYPEAKFAAVDENGNVDADKLKAMFVPDRKNYVVLDTERTGMILSVTNLMLGEMANSPLQLAILEPNETLDYDEVSMKRLTILKLLYPSLTRDNASPEAQQFDNAYREKNKVFPNQYAVRGFDVTFDTMLRLSQDKSFADAASDKTQQIEGKFNYVKNLGDGYMNKGVYILEYQDDLSVKEAE